MDLSEAKVLAELLIEEHLDDSWGFAWNNRKRAYGTCCYRTKTIELSKPMTRGEIESQVEDTILHEIAHAIAGPGAGHGKLWKAIARSIGAVPRATARSTAKPEDRPEYTWVMIIKGTNEFVRGFYRKPTAKRMAGLPGRYIRGRREETLGKLDIIPFAAYKRASTPD